MTKSDDARFHKVYGKNTQSYLFTRRKSTTICWKQTVYFQSIAYTRYNCLNLRKIWKSVVIWVNNRSLVIKLTNRLLRKDVFVKYGFKRSSFAKQHSKGSRNERSLLVYLKAQSMPPQKMLGTLENVNHRCERDYNVWKNGSFIQRCNSAIHGSNSYLELSNGTETDS